MMLIIPVANGVLPQPDGGRITGAFMMEQGGKLLTEIGIGHDVLICPWVVDDQLLYPVGVIARLADMRIEVVANPEGEDIPVLAVVLEGRGHARWHTLSAVGNRLLSRDVELLNFKNTRKEYPVISGAGWMPAGGYTEFRDAADIPVTIYGTDLETGQEVKMTANLGGLVAQEQAHTIEHAIIRALRVYGLCTARTLADALFKETQELKQSVETSIRYALPEALGVTATGACGNPMTSLAQFYLAQEFIDNIAAGKRLDEALTKARRSAMSQLTQDIGMTLRPGLRTLQGLKKGMSHDDTPLKVEISKKVIARFPFEPWE